MLAVDYLALLAGGATFEIAFGAIFFAALVLLAAGDYFFVAGVLAAALAGTFLPFAVTVNFFFAGAAPLVALVSSFLVAVVAVSATAFAA